MKQIGLIALLAASLGMFAIGAPSEAQAQEPAEQEASGGFYGRASLGLGVASTGFATNEDDFRDQDATLGGVAVSYDAALGFELPFGLAIHGSYRGWVAPSPNFKFDGSSTEIDGAKLTLHNFGVGATFSPNVFFVSLMAGPAWLKYEFDNFGVSGNTRGDDSWGIGSELGLGAMFYNTPNFGIGLAAFGSFHWIAETRDSDKGLLGYQASGRVILEF